MAVLTRNGYVAILTLCVFLILQIYQAQQELQSKQNTVIQSYHRLEKECNVNIDFLCNSPEFIVFFADIIEWRPFSPLAFDEIVLQANRLFDPTISQQYTAHDIKQLQSKIIQGLTEFAQFTSLVMYVAIAQERFKRLCEQQFR